MIKFVPNNSPSKMNKYLSYAPQSYSSKKTQITKTKLAEELKGVETTHKKLKLSRQSISSNSISQNMIADSRNGITKLIPLNKILTRQAKGTIQNYREFNSKLILSASMESRRLSNNSSSVELNMWGKHTPMSRNKTDLISLSASSFLSEFQNVSMAGLSGMGASAQKKRHICAYTPSTNRSFVSEID